MKIGITYDLRENYISEGYGEEETAEFDKPETIDAIELALQDLDFKTDRIGHVKNLAFRLVNGERWDLVFNIAEGLKGFGREAQVPCLLDSYNIPYTFSDPLALTISLHKGMAKRIIRDLGILTPPFVIIESTSDTRTVSLPFPLFAKPIAEGTGKGITFASRINNRSDLITICTCMLEKYGQPVLVEAFLEGREFTVGIVGTGHEAKSIGIMEIVLNNKAENNAYSYYNKENYKEVAKYHLVNDSIATEAEKMALAAWKGLGCKDAGRVDLRADSHGVPNILEVNPLPGLHPKHSDLPILCNLSGIPYNDLIRMIMESALKRLGKEQSLGIKQSIPVQFDLA